MVAGFRLIVSGTLMLFMLSACSSSSPVRYFSLSPIDSDIRQDSEDAVMLGLGPLRMPDYLDRSQIVTRGTNAEMQVDDFTRWSEPLATSLPRIVSTNVDNLLQGVVVVMFPYEPFVHDQVKYRLVGDINRFEADHKGHVVLEIQWGIADTKRKVIVPVRRNRYTAEAATGGNTDTAAEPGAVVAAMNDVLAQFSRDIAGKLEAALAY